MFLFQDINAIPSPIICKTCWNIIGTIYDFRKACIETETHLIKLLKDNAITNVHDNIEDSTSECGKDEIEIRLAEITGTKNKQLHLY